MLMLIKLGITLVAAKLIVGAFWGLVASASLFHFGVK